MTAKIKQIHPVFVGEVSDVDLREPLSAEDVQIIDEGMARYGVLVFHGDLFLLHGVEPEIYR